MEIIKGDLIALAKAGEFDVICHGCNCFHSFGSGIAKTIKEEFPDAYNADLMTAFGSKEKLGTYSYGDWYSDSGHRVSIANLYTQHKYGRSKDFFEYEAFEKVLQELNSFFGNTPSRRWGFPEIGCGLAGGDKQRIMQILEENTKNLNVTVVQYTKEDK